MASVSGKSNKKTLTSDNDKLTLDVIKHISEMIVGGLSINDVSK